MKIRKKRNKYLIYDENTKLIEVKAGTKSTNAKSKFQIFLEQKKIYFETIMMFILSLAGIIVSIVGVKVAMMANDITLNEQKIEDLEKQPAFILDVEVEEEREKYIIKNVGGDIKYGNVFGDELLIVSVYNDQYDYLGKGYIFLKGYWEQRFSTYDFETNCFELYCTLEPKPVMEWVEKIEKLIVAQGFFCETECVKYFDFLYADYKQEMTRKCMIVKWRMMEEAEITGTYGFEIWVNIDDLEDEEVYSELKEQLERLVKYSSAHS